MGPTAEILLRWFWDGTGMEWDGTGMVKFVLDLDFCTGILYWDFVLGFCTGILYWDYTERQRVDGSVCAEVLLRWYCGSTGCCFHLCFLDACEALDAPGLPIRRRDVCSVVWILSLFHREKMLF